MLFLIDAGLERVRATRLEFLRGRSCFLGALSDRKLDCYLIVT